MATPSYVDPEKMKQIMADNNGNPFGAATAMKNYTTQAKTDFETKTRAFTPGMATGDINLPDPSKYTAFDLGQKYQAKDVSGPLQEYDKLRNDVVTQNATAKSGAMDALERKFAAMGNLNSGSYIKQSQITDDQYNQNANKALNDVGVQEAQARRGLQSAEDQKVFQSGEAMNQRGFQASGQMRQEQAQGFDQKTKLRQLDLALHQANNESLDSQFNAEMAKYSAEHSGGLLGSGGFLGLGI